MNSTNQIQQDSDQEISPVPTPPAATIPPISQSDQKYFFARIYQNRPVGNLMREGTGELDAYRKLAETNHFLEVKKIKIQENPPVQTLSNVEFYRYIKYYKGEPIGEIMSDNEGTLEAALIQAENNDDLDVKLILMTILN